ncbi:MAG TPA: metallophosphoesterase [Symbiobacteriaceae bacterium]|jgi:3',5'-cyclic AMP phosphodiesterase CpdA
MLDRRRFLIAAGSILAASAFGCARVLPGGAPLASSGKSGPGPGAGGVPPVPEPGAPAPFRVALFSDVHLQPGSGEMQNTKLQNAVNDYGALKPDLWLTDGDIADHGAGAEHEAFRAIIDRVAKPGHFLVTTGNHEFYDMKTTDDVSVRRFTEAYGLPKPYSSKVIGGVHFVMLADEQWQTAPYQKDWCWITPEQLRWFEQVLTEHRDSFTVVCMHQPLNDTVAASQGPRAFGSSNFGPELHELRRKNPQVKLWFSGHTHRALQAQGQVVQQEQTTFAALGSTAYLLQTGAGVGRDPDASQSRFMEIYPDKVVIRARDHAARAWMDQLELTVPRA